MQGTSSPHLGSCRSSDPCRAGCREPCSARSGGESRENLQFARSLVRVLGVLERFEYDVAMAAIAADSGSEKAWSRVVSSVSFSLPTSSGYVEKARKAASSTVQFSSKVLWSTGEVAWSTGKAAWSVGASLLVSVVPRMSKMDHDTHTVDLEGGAPATPRSAFLK